MLPDPSTEPVRRAGYLAALVVALSSTLGIVAVTDTVTVQSVALALSIGLAEFGVVAFGVERARQLVRPETSHLAVLDEVVDAEASLRLAAADAAEDTRAERS
jgi:CelD/BcsL family acetyltransferase involved in cellulose biosynthesis